MLVASYLGAEWMPRPPRLHIPGACYHVILRGNHREALFGDGGDQYVLNEIVAAVPARFDCRVHAFCWMTNHLHALLQISERPLGAIMQHIAVRYSRYRHRSLQTCGHLFERRYKAKLVDVDAYFLALIRYIHLNPVKALIVGDPADYPWSSHRAYLGVQSISWLTTDFALSMFSTDLARARAAYRQFAVASSTIDDDLADESHPRDRRILGTDQFIERIRPIVCKPGRSLTLDQLAETLCRQHGITVEYLRSPSRARHLTPVRIALVTRAVEQGVATLCEIARFLHRDPSALSKLMARHNERRQVI